MGFGNMGKLIRKVASPLPEKPAVDAAPATIKTGATTAPIEAPAAPAAMPKRSKLAWRGHRGGIGGGLAIGRGPAGSRNFRRMI